MRYYSTRAGSAHGGEPVSGAAAILRGLAADGGLLVPDGFPTLAPAEIERLAGLAYPERAAYIMELFLPDFSAEELLEFARAAYGADKFDGGDAAPVVKHDGDTFFLELWHGPTSAFKDMALQMLPRLLSASLGKTGETRDACILVATSGDTGKAALEGFRDVPRVRIMVFYPRDGVSDVQKLQMTTQEGGNVAVLSVNGNFDDAQTGVKDIFSDEDFRAGLNDTGWFLSSANSINWGRLLPQIVYYVSAYCDLTERGEIQPGEAIDFCVPTGNFGNILAGYYARKMGLPIRRLICASNRNDVLTDFIATGVYDRNREFFTTASPSMDILVSSNLERLLYDLSGAPSVAAYMRRLGEAGKYEVAPEVRARIQEIFRGGTCGDEETREIILRVFERNGYLLDTHTAVAYGVLEKVRAEDTQKNMDTDAHIKTVVISTASPFKFCGAVLGALGGDAEGEGLALIDRLEEISGKAAPAPLKSLRGKSPRFEGGAETGGMRDAVRAFLR
ncbi:MAG: threonine synthase [Oscillospiraceae bacterium]|jgi:threonine synthase|nr:threonine synthase [Oscillospiraceae bacterium]